MVLTPPEHYNGVFSWWSVAWMDALIMTKYALLPRLWHTLLNSNGLGVCRPLDM
jgi:hypothetical protein